MYRILLTGLLAVLNLAVYSQNFNLCGKITNEKSEPLAGATIRLKPGSRVTISDQIGSFLFSDLPKGNYALQVSFIGYQRKEVSINLNQNSSEEIIRLYPALEMLDEVVISDQYFHIRKNSDSRSLELVNQDYLDKFREGNLMSSLSRLPGVSMISIGTGTAKPVIRGLGFNRIAVIDNGIKHQSQQWGLDHGLEIDQLSVERIEVIKGPASLRYGSDAIGGVVRILPDINPDDGYIKGYLNSVYNSQNSYFGNSAKIAVRKAKWILGLNMTIADYADTRVPTDTVDIYSYRIGLYNRQLRNTAGKERNAGMRLGYSGSRISSLFYLTRYDSREGFFANAHGLEPRGVDYALHDQSARDIQYPYQDVIHDKIINQTMVQLGAGELEIESGYQHNERHEWNKYINHGYMPPSLPDSLGINPDLEREFTKQVFSTNINIGLNHSIHKLDIGINLEYQDQEIDGWSFIIPAYQQTTSGIYLFDHLALGEKLSIEGGLRFSMAHINIQEYSDWFESLVYLNDSVQMPKALQRSPDMNRQFNDWSWSLGLIYQSGHLSSKMHLGKSFRIPTPKELGANGVNYHFFSYEQGDPDLSKENAWQFDLTTGWHNNLWAAEISPFITYFPNFIYLNPTWKHDYAYGAGNQVFEYTQNKVLRWGGECHAHYNFSNYIKAGLIAEYSYSRQLSGEKKGYSIPFAPPARFLFNVEYHPADSRKLTGRYLLLDTGLSMAQNWIVPPEEPTPGYLLINIGAGSAINIGSNHLQLNMKVLNLLNKKYLNHTSYYRLIGLPEAGRSISLSLKLFINQQIKKNEKR